MKKTLLCTAFLFGLSATAVAQEQHQHHHHHDAAAAVDQKNLPDFTQAYLQDMEVMHEPMMTGILNPNPDMAFAKGMIPHHVGAVEMAETELKYGKDDTLRKLAEDIIKAQQPEIDLMEKWLSQQPEDLSIKAEDVKPFNEAYLKGMEEMHTDMMTGILAPDPDVAFAKGMLPHHVGAVEMAKIELEYGKDDTMRKLAKEIIQAQEPEIALMREWLKKHDHQH